MHNSKYACALSSLTESAAAARAAATEVKSRLLEGRLDALFVFFTEQYDAAVLMAGVRAVFGTETPVVGCEAPGVICGDRVTHRGVVVAGIRWGVSIHPFLAASSAEGSEQTGRTATEGAIAAIRAKGHSIEGGHGLVLLMPDAATGSGVDAVRGAVEVAGNSVRVMGGGSCDDLKFQKASQLCDGTVVQGGVLAVALSSPKPLGIGLRHGFEPWGMPMQATEVKGRTLAGIDFVAAFERYKSASEELGVTGLERDGLASFARLHPLGLTQGDGEHVLRSALSVTVEGAIVCGADVPENAVVRLMKGEPSTLIAAAREAAEEAQKEMQPVRPGAALVFSCVSRELALEADASGKSPELVALRESLGANVPTFGCVSFGSIGTLGNGGAQMHSASVSLCLFPA